MCWTFDDRVVGCVYIAIRILFLFFLFLYVVFYWNLEDGRLTVLEAYEETLDRTVEHPRLKRNVSYKTLVRTDVYSLKKHVLTGEPYRATERWW